VQGSTGGGGFGGGGGGTGPGGVGAQVPVTAVWPLSGRGCISFIVLK